MILQRRSHGVCSVLALEYIENCQSGVSFVAFCCFDGQILIQKFTKFDRAYVLVQGNLLVLAVKNALRVSLFMFRVLKL